MIKFTALRKLKTIIVFNVFIKYFLWCWFFTFQGKAINIAIEKSELPKQLIYSLIGFLAVKIIVMICDVFQKFITAYYKNIELKQQWSQSFPKNIYSDNKNNKNHVNVFFFDYLPKIFDFEVSITTNRVTVCYIFTLVVVVFLHSGFFIEILALLLVFLLNFISKNIFTKEIDAYQVKINDDSIKILNWVDQYFTSYREISKNWKGIVNSSWRDDIYKKYYFAKNNQIFFYLYRDLLSQLLVEFPFLLNTATVIIGVFCGYLTVTELFIWVGFSQFMIIASNAYFENRMNKRQLATLSSKASDILCDFKPKTSPVIEEKLMGEHFTAEVILRDGTKNFLSTAPGIYHIKGKNGSGKSTLMNIVLDYERQDRFFKNVNFSQLALSIKQDNVRVVERNAIIFDCFDNFNDQVSGPVYLSSGSWKDKVNQSLYQLLEPNLAKQWKEIFASLEEEYRCRKDRLMSSGEKVILSFMRFFASWDSKVNLLIVDECDSFLDQDKKNIFIKTMNNLAFHMAVYISTHDALLGINALEG